MFGPSIFPHCTLQHPRVCSCSHPPSYYRIFLIRIHTFPYPSLYHSVFHNLLNRFLRVGLYHSVVHIPFHIFLIFSSYALSTTHPCVHSPSHHLFFQDTCSYTARWFSTTCSYTPIHQGTIQPSTQPVIHFFHSVTWSFHTCSCTPAALCDAITQLSTRLVTSPLSINT